MTPDALCARCGERLTQDHECNATWLAILEADEKESKATKRRRLEEAKRAWRDNGFEFV